MRQRIRGGSISSKAMRPDAVSSVTEGRRSGRSQAALATGIPNLDGLIQGFPRGAIAEIIGPETSGRTTLLHSLLAAATSGMEVCAYVDTSDTFDPFSAAQTGVALSRLIWIRCRNNTEHALRAVDNLLYAGGFGVVALDLGRVTPQVCRRIQMSYWHRFRRAVEKTHTVLVVIDKEPLAKSCASLQLEMRRKRGVWTGAKKFSLLQELQVEVASRKPIRSAAALLKARALEQQAEGRSTGADPRVENVR